MLCKLVGCLSGFCDHILQVIQCGSKLFPQFLYLCQDIFQQVVQFFVASPKFVVWFSLHCLHLLQLLIF